MEHIREWCTCDRCGKEIESWKRIPFYIPFKSTRLERMSYETVDKRAYISDIIKDSNIPDSCRINVVSKYGKSKKEIQLCKKCRDDFKKFMEWKLDDE